MFTAEIQYAVVRYMLNELGDEAANVGLVAFADSQPYLHARFLEDPTVKSRSDSKVQVDTVQRFVGRAKVLMAKHLGTADVIAPSAYFEQLRELGGNLVRLSPLRSVLTNNISGEFALLYEQLVEPSQQSETREYGPRDPLGRLRREARSALIHVFREAYGKPLSSPRFEKQYEIKAKAGHTNIIDLALVSKRKTRRIEHLFQHLLLLPDAEENYTQAAGLCYKWLDIQRANHATRDMTAVLYGRKPQDPKSLKDSLKILRKEEVKVVRLTELPAVVRRIAIQQRELDLKS
jgi:hypothetical protein